MSVVGIVAEYNPFHNGHKYHIEESKRMTGADAVVCVMSGNFVQRGQPAVLDKWARTQIALRNGVDVVIEIPTVYCLGNASFYARASVKLLEALGSVDSISFGAESGSIEELYKVATRLNEASDSILSLTKEHTKAGHSYPAARAIAYEQLFGESPDVLKGSNNVLAIEYLRHITCLNAVSVRRNGAGYDELVDDSHRFQSSTGIRRLLKEDSDVGPYVPYNTDDYSEEYNLSEDLLLAMIRYKLLSMNADEIDRYPGGGEGIGNRLIASARDAESVDDLIIRTKSKRYTYTHISRLVYQILLGIGREMAEADPEYIRVLGFTERGRELLHEVKRGELNKLPIYMNLSKINSVPEQLALDIHAADVYNLAAGRNLTGNNDYKISPIIFK